MANVAQLVELRFVVPAVVSSSLIVRPIFENPSVEGFFLRTIRLLFEPVSFRKFRVNAQQLHFGQVIVTFALFRLSPKAN